MDSKLHEWKDDIVEPSRILSAYLEWGRPHFAEDSILLTACLLRAEQDFRVVAACFNFIERKVHLRRPGRILRLPVRVKDKTFPHVHALIKNVPYADKKCDSFESLIRNTFENRLPTTNDVHVVSLSGREGVPLLYSLQKQGDVQVMLDAFYLPPATS